MSKFFSNVIVMITIIFSGQKALNKTICFELMYRAFLKTQNFEDSELAYVYDSRSTLFTNLPIRKSNVGCCLQTNFVETPDLDLD